MTRTKKTDKINEYAVLYLRNTMKMEDKEIAKQLGINLSEVKKTISPEASEEKQEKQQTTRKSKSQDLMIRHTSNKKTNNVSIMTEAASQYNDEAKKSMVKTQSRRYKGCISNPNIKNE